MLEPWLCIGRGEGLGELPQLEPWLFWGEELWELPMLEP